MNELALFAGGLAGCSEGLSEWCRTVAYCEIDEFRQHMLASRMDRGEIVCAPIWPDVRTLKGSYLPEIDIITGTFPCQDVSLAGRREGLEGKRSGLFWEIVRLADETKASFVFLENVWPGIRPYISTIRSAFEKLRYSCRDGHLSAADCGARHRRERWFLLGANTDGIKLRLQSLKSNWQDQTQSEDHLEERHDTDSNSGRGNSRRIKQATRPISADGFRPVEARNDSDSDSARMAERRTEVGDCPQLPFSVDALEGDNWDERAAFLLRVDSGLPYWGKRISALGDSCPPIQYKTAFERLLGGVK